MCYGLGGAAGCSGTFEGQREGTALARDVEVFRDHAMDGATTRGVDHRQLHPWHAAL